MRVPFLLPILPLGLPTACTPAHMAVPAPLSADAAATVEGARRIGRGEVRIGDFVATGVRRGWTVSSTEEVGPLDQTRARRTYGFTQEGPDGLSWPVRCGTDYDASTLEWSSPDGVTVTSVTAGSRTNLVCTALTGTDRPDWLLELAADSDRPLLEGTLRDDHRVIRVFETRDLEGTALDLNRAAGFVFADGDAPIAAVEVLNRGRAWLPEGGDPELRHAVVAAMTALLLYRDPSR